MKKLNSHQIRLWENMLQRISDFRMRRISYSSFVGKLEGDLDASDIKDQRIVEQWYDNWMPLEIERATHGDGVENLTIEIYLKNFEEFIRSEIT